MNILAKCPKCGRVIQFTHDKADTRTKCPTCGKRFKVPPLEQMDEAVKVIKDTKATVFVDQKGKTYG